MFVNLQSREPPPLSAARKLSRQRHKALILCASVGHTGNAAIPSGYQTADCSDCGSAVWVSPHSIAAARANGYTPGYLCNLCVPPPNGGGA